MMPLRRRAIVLAVAVLAALGTEIWPAARSAPQAPQHPSVLFDAAGLQAIRAKANDRALAAVTSRLIARAEALLAAAPLLVSTTGRGEPDPPGHLKGIEAARRLQGRALTWSMAFLLSGDRRYRDAAVTALEHAIDDWPIWVDTAHAPPFDLMSGEMSLTFGLAYDWLYDALSPAERGRLRDGVERRAMATYLEATSREPPPFWFTVQSNWNPVCNGGATVLALALGADSALSERTLQLAAPTMAHYWDHLGDDGGWDEGTGYWTYGHRYAFMAADALRRAGRREGADYLGRKGARATGYFPLVFNPGARLSASFGDSGSRAADPIFYFLAHEYQNPDFAWFQDRAEPSSLTHEGWPEEALTLIWKPVNEPWQRRSSSGIRPNIPAVASFGSIGWAMLAPSQPDPPFFLAFKSGSLAASHSHLDLNHVSMAVGDKMLLVELGSRPYPADYFSAARFDYYEITTAGHNTVLIGGKGQASGKPGILKGPFEGPRYSAFEGVADGAYEVATPHARRHVVFVDRRYFVLLDDIRTASPAPIEIRFHTYGSVAAQPGGGWTISQGGRSLSVIPADKNAVAGTTDRPAGWIEPVTVLRLAGTGTDGQLLLATALVPGSGEHGRVPIVRQERRGNDLLVFVGDDRVTFREDAGGFAVSAVRTGTAGSRPAQPDRPVSVGR